MTHFEYVAVMFSIILGLGIVRLLGSLDTIFSKHRYWPHSIWMLTIFWLHIQNWWGLWELRNLSLNIVSYSVTIGFVSTLYLCTVALTNRHGNDTSWRDHFFAQRQWFFGVLAFSILVGTFSTRVFLGASLLHPYRLVQLSLFFLAVLGLISDREAVHRYISVLFFLLMALGVSAFRFLPDMFNGAS